jgi:lipid II:glycine glycyltransferase (peptidoglycan interpeptide bridge formation enzyme)
MAPPAAHQYAVAVDGDSDGPQWDAFLADTPSAQYQQTSLWARVKAAQGWRAARALITRDGLIHGGAQVLYRSLPLGRIGFVARGPVVAGTDPALAATAAAGVVQLARECSLTYLVVQPPSVNADLITHQLVRRGFRAAPQVVAPHVGSTVLLDLRDGEAALLRKMRSSTRGNIRLSERRGVTVRQGDAEDVPVFHSLLTATARRQEFLIPPAAVFADVWAILAPHGAIRMGVAEFDGEPLSAFLWLVFGDSLTYWRGAWSGEHAELRPNEALHWAGIRWAASAGLRWYDLEGVTHFKKGLGGQVLALPGPFELVPNRVLRRLYPAAFHRLADSRGASRVRERLRTRSGLAARRAPP